MELRHGLHLAYCTNIHRGETWAETLASLETHTLAVKQAVCPQGRYAIGLRLSDQASRELSERSTLAAFQRWLEAHDCYVFTINGFPFGRFHGTRVKEQVYRPDWTSPERLDYTNRLFDLLAQLLPEGVAGSVSTLPGSFKEFIRSADQEQAIRQNLWRCVEHLAALSERTGRELHLGLEPEPLGWFENTAETVRFFESMQVEHGGDPGLLRCLGVNYDTCHFAIEFEEPATALAALRRHGIRLSKIHLSNALAVTPTPAVCEALRAFADGVYLHQVIRRAADGALRRWKDLNEALAGAAADGFAEAEEWRIHFHIPLHAQPGGVFRSTASHAIGLLESLRAEPALCSHLEMETYTWDVLPPAMRSRTVVEQIVGEYEWTLAQLKTLGLSGKSS